jgi:hypothetical protein
VSIIVEQEVAMAASASKHTGLVNMARNLTSDRGGFKPICQLVQIPRVTAFP